MRARLFTTNNRGGAFVTYCARRNDEGQMTASGAARCGGGNAASSAASISRESVMSAALRFSRTCSGFAALGIALNGVITSLIAPLVPLLWH